MVEQKVQQLTEKSNVVVCVACAGSHRADFFCGFRSSPRQVRQGGQQAPQVRPSFSSAEKDRSSVFSRISSVFSRISSFFDVVVHRIPHRNMSTLDSFY